MLLSWTASGIGLLIGALTVTARPLPTLADWQAQVARRPGDIAAQRALASAYSAAGQATLAYPHWRRVATAWPTDLDAQRAVAAAALAQGEPVVALAARRAIVTADPSDTLTAHQLGDQLAAQGDPAGALVVWERAAQHARAADRASAESKLIAPYLAAQRTTAALQAAQQALDADPHRLDAWCGLGDTYVQLGQPQKAQYAYSTCATTAQQSTDPSRTTWTHYAQAQLTKGPTP